MLIPSVVRTDAETASLPESQSLLATRGTVSQAAEDSSFKQGPAHPPAAEHPSGPPKPYKCQHHFNSMYQNELTLSTQAQLVPVLPPVIPNAAQQPTFSQQAHLYHQQQALYQQQPRYVQQPGYTHQQPIFANYLPMPVPIP